jgi:zinc D-Ala-D-Ala carboxypeptidase
MNLSDHFTVEELVQSQTAERRGIDNTPTDAIIANLRFLASRLEQVRALLGAPILISSGYRCPALNQAVGGAANSQHMQGLAADLICPRMGTPVEVCRRIAQSDLAFDQLIYEYTWCHLGLGQRLGDPPRRHIMTLNRATGGYDLGING